MEKKKILVIANYFYPDVASLGQLITDFCFKLNYKYDFTVVAAIPNYDKSLDLDYDKKKLSYFDEIINDIKVKRVIVPNVDKRNKLSRISYILKYYSNSRKAIRSIKEYDIVFTVSQPPILGGLLGAYAKKKMKGSKLIYNIQDFNPEQIEAVKYSKFKMLINVMRKIDSSSLEQSDKVLLVGSDQLETLERRNSKYLSKAVVINNWSDDDAIIPLDNNIEIENFKIKYGLKDKFIIMYSGNIGLFYDLDNLIKVIGKFRERKDVIFLFVGEGAVKKDLIEYKEKNQIENIVFLGYQPKDMLKISLNVADVHLVVNAKGIKGVSVPSKIYGVMAAGKPIIGVLEEGSEARRIIDESNSGICIDPCNYSQFEEIIKCFINKEVPTNKMGLNSRMYLDENLNRNLSINKYDKLFESL